MMDTLWNDTPETETGGRKDREMTDLPDGEYDGKIVDFSCFRANSGDWFISWWIELDTGLRAGALLESFRGLNERTVGFAKSDFRTILGRIPGWSDMADDETGRTGPIRGEVVGARVRVRQRSRQHQGTTYKDVYLNELLEPAQGRQETPRQPARVETRREAPGGFQRPEAPTPTEASAPSKDDWGDPGCSTCHGKGCDNCVSF